MYKIVRNDSKGIPIVNIKEHKLFIQELYMIQDKSGTWYKVCKIGDPDKYVLTCMDCCIISGKCIQDFNRVYSSLDSVIKAAFDAGCDVYEFDSFEEFINWVTTPTFKDEDSE